MLLAGSAGGGKSKIAAEKVHGFLLKYPKATGLMMRKTRQSMTNSTVLFFEKDIAQGDCIHVSSKNRFEYPNGSVLAYGGMADEEQKEQIRSIGQAGGADIVWMEEANRFTEDDFNEVLARLRGSAAPWTQVILSTNPGAPTHWIKRRLIDQGEAHVYYSKAQDNTHNPAEYLNTLQRLTGVAHRRLVDGLWVQAEGAVYEGWDDSIHVLSWQELEQLGILLPNTKTLNRKKVKRVIGGCDFGWTNPGSLIVVAVDEDSRLYVVHEVYQTKRLIGWWVKEALKLRDLYHVELFVCDPAEPALIQEYRNAGLFALEADNAIVDGIQRVAQRLELAGDGRPRLYVARGALRERDPLLIEAKKPTGLLEELPAYEWPIGTDNRPVKEIPVPINDHSLDPLRYVCSYVDAATAQVLPKPRMREVIG